jgi:predicted nucleotidyltransferase
MIYQDFLELLHVLEKHKVKYAIIGGYAVGIHAEPRYTKDLDLIIDPTLKNGKALLAALDEFGAPINNLTKEEIAKPGLLYVFGIEPLRVDILNRIKGTSVSKIINRSEKIKLQNTVMSVVSVPDLIKLKKLASRPQDLVDIQKLLEHKKKVDNSSRRGPAKKKK